MVRRIVLAFVVLACGIALALGARTTAKGHDDSPGTLTISIRDFCDPPTFNAVIAPDACIRDDDVTANGSQKFAGFLFELGQERSAGAWRFNPDRARSKEGVNLTLVNRGGETHTFTRVGDFGGGFVAALNTVSGNPAPRLECARMVNGQLVPQPPSANNIFINHGQTLMGPRIVEDEQVKFQCCIHPWMRLTINPDEDRRHGRD